MGPNGGILSSKVIAVLIASPGAQAHLGCEPLLRWSGVLEHSNPLRPIARSPLELAERGEADISLFGRKCGGSLFATDASA
jgi:hypothetical protein